MRALRSAAVFALVAASGCAGVRETIRDRPRLPEGAFEPRELVDVLPYGRIPAIERPRFESAAKADEWLDGSSPVAVLTLGADARAYPLAILLWHEIVDDVVDGAPVAVTYSPLTGAAAAFDRRVDGRTEVFRVSGKLYRSDLVLADRRTRSLWPQLLGRAVAGRAKGARLVPLPVQVSSFGAFRASFPQGIVLSRVTGSTRAYGLNPYAGYLARTGPFPGFFAPRPDVRLRPMERAVALSDGSGWRAYPVSALARAGVTEDRVSAGDVVLFWQRGTRSALDTADIARGRDVGSTGAFLNRTRIGRLELEATATGFRDRDTGSTWTVLGVATAGPLKGERLTPIAAVDAFWFAWAGFYPSTTIVTGS